MALDKLINLVLSLRTISKGNWSLIIGDRLHHLTDPDEKEFYTGVIEGLIVKVLEMGDLTDKEIRSKIIDEAAYITGMLEANYPFSLDDIPPVKIHGTSLIKEDNSHCNLNDVLPQLINCEGVECLPKSFLSEADSCNLTQLSLLPISHDFEASDEGSGKNRWYREMELDQAIRRAWVEPNFATQDAIKGISMFGECWSGKSTIINAFLGENCLKAGFGGLVLCDQENELTVWKTLMDKVGRLDSLIVFDLGGDWSFPFFQYFTSQIENELIGIESLVRLFMDVHETTSNSRSVDPYWTEALHQLTYNAISLCLAARGTVNIPLLNEVINTAPRSEDLYKSKEWQDTSLCWELLLESRTRNFSTWKEYNFHDLSSYWLEAFPKVSSRTQTEVISMFTNITNIFLHHPFQKVFAENISDTQKSALPELTHQGMVIVMNVPTVESGNLGQVAQIVYKTIWQQAAKRRKVSKNSRPIFLWTSKTQSFTDENDIPLSLMIGNKGECQVVTKSMHLSDAITVRKKMSGNLPFGAINKVPNDYTSEQMTCKFRSIKDMFPQTQYDSFTSEQIVAQLVKHIMCLRQSPFINRHNILKSNGHLENIEAGSYHYYNMNSISLPPEAYGDSRLGCDGRNSHYKLSLLEKTNFCSTDMTRLTVSVGRKDYIRPGDIIGAIAVSANIPGNTIGCVNVFDRFTYIDISKDVVDHVINAMEGNTIKGCRVNVEVANNIFN